jgi:hypothetical protein
MPHSEVDFLALGGGARLVECKWSSRPDKGDAKNIVRLVMAAKEKQTLELVDARGYIMCRTEGVYDLPESSPPIKAAGIADIPGMLG